MTENQLVISADGHILEPTDLFVTRLPKNDVAEACVQKLRGLGVDTRAILRGGERMGIYFLELFVAFLQAYIFAMLSALYIGMGVAMGAHQEHPAEGTQPSAH